MIKSMTGFGRAFETVNGRDITVELKSVNHRYFEASVRVPRAYSFLEDKVKNSVQQRIARGKLDVGVLIADRQGAEVAVTPNLGVARGYFNALQTIASEFGISAEISAQALARFPDVFTVAAEGPDEDALFADVRAVLDEALDNFLQMRRTEGERLKKDLEEKLANLETLLERVERDAEGRIEKYRQKLYDKMQAVLKDAAVDENRVMLEAALYADRSAIDEETVRLRSHISQFRTIIESDEPSGRKLDFLTQELNREVNTIGSKANELDITGAVVEMKAEIEKIREQIQNIE